MIRIRYNGHEKHLQLAVGTVNSLLTDYTFYDKISAHTQFDLSDIKPINLSELIKNAHFEMEIDFYYSILPFSNAMTYDDNENPNLIWLNKWNLDRPVDSLCNTLMHQCIHAVNAQHPHLNFGHGDNNPRGKENTAPYWIACLAQKMLLNDDMQACDCMVHEEMYNIPRVSLHSC